MKLCSYLNSASNLETVGFYKNNKLYAVSGLSHLCFGQQSQLKGELTLWMLLQQWEKYKPELNELYQLVLQEDIYVATEDFNSVKILPPLSVPTTFRDFYAFEQHVKTARSLRGFHMIPEWYEMPVFYFSNPHCFHGHKDTISYPQGSQALDYELEIGIYICKKGSNISVEKASEYIGGYTILNDWSARDIQRKEMKVGLGPAKGKDFATSVGPLFVTPDEITAKKQQKLFNLTMVAKVNGKEYSRGNASTIYYSFEEMIAAASLNTTLYPGDLIGSGTVGTGCILELTSEAVGGWLQPSDTVELEVEDLGTLINYIGE